MMKFTGRNLTCARSWAGFSAPGWGVLTSSSFSTSSQSRGTHVFIDLENADDLCTPSGFKWLTKNLGKNIDKSPINIVHHHLGKYGSNAYTSAFLLDESHATIHCKNGRIAMDVFTCGKTDPVAILDGTMEKVHQELPEVIVAQRKVVPRFFSEEQPEKLSRREDERFLMTPSVGKHCFFDVIGFTPETTTRVHWLVDTMEKRMKEHFPQSAASMIHKKAIPLPPPSNPTSPPGFTGCYLQDEAHVTAHAYEDIGLLAMDVFTNGLVDCDAVAFSIMKDLVEECGEGLKLVQSQSVLRKFPVSVPIATDDTTKSSNFVADSTQQFMSS